jgi:hypothetical protein
MGQVKQSFSPAIGVDSGTVSKQVGWTAGAGLEFCDLELRLGRKSRMASRRPRHFRLHHRSGANNQTIGIRFTEEVFRLGINDRLK